MVETIKICFSYICRTDPKDVARVESKTYIITENKYDTVCHTAEGVAPIMGNWMSPDQLSQELDSRFPNCMAGKSALFISLNWIFLALRLRVL